MQGSPSCGTRHIVAFEVTVASSYIATTWTLYTRFGVRRLSGSAAPSANTTRVSVVPFTAATTCSSPAKAVTVYLVKNPSGASNAAGSHVTSMVVALDGKHLTLPGELARYAQDSPRRGSRHTCRSTAATPVFAMFVNVYGRASTRPSTCWPSPRLAGFLPMRTIKSRPCGSLLPALIAVRPDMPSMAAARKKGITWS